MGFLPSTISKKSTLSHIFTMSETKTIKTDVSQRTALWIVFEGVFQFLKAPQNKVTICADSHRFPPNFF